jgi:hypothetical protein
LRMKYARSCGPRHDQAAYTTNDRAMLRTLDIFVELHGHGLVKSSYRLYATTKKKKLQDKHSATSLSLHYDKDQCFVKLCAKCISSSTPFPYRILSRLNFSFIFLTS